MKVSNAYKARRRFLKQTLCCAAVGSGAIAMNGKLSLIGSALAQSSSVGNDYRALVCVFLYGGADSFNLYMPSESALFANYEASRGSLALNRSELQASADGNLLMHPELGRLRARYDEGQVSLVRNVGNLIQPLTKSDFTRGGTIIPPDLFAHNHQQEQWQKGWTSRPTTLIGTGWGGRMADLLDDANAGSSLPPIYSLDGSNYFSGGSRVTPVAVDTRYGARSLPYLDVQANRRNTARDETMARVLGLSRQNLLADLAGERFTQARENAALVSDIVATNPAPSSGFTTRSDIGPQLEMVSRLIAGRQRTGQRRQIYFVGMNGWDTHDSQSTRLVQLARDLDIALDGFQTELDRLGVSDQVTTFTASDFGRTLTINGDGSDHGWGSHHLVMGGAVNGNLLGSWPSYETGGSDDTSDRGRVIPSTSVNEYGAMLASWMGLSDSEIRTILPDISNFGNGWQGMPLFRQT